MKIKFIQYWWKNSLKPIIILTIFWLLSLIIDIQFLEYGYWILFITTIAGVFNYLMWKNNVSDLFSIFKK